MTFEYDEFADSLHVSISEPASSCVYVEGETAGVLLRVEETTGIVRGFEISAWKKRIAHGQILIPEIGSQDFVKEWLSSPQTKDLPQRR